eukprot:CAMPEP_0185735676 /NCGR_PEP_ID=MMETSP1171-20130828/25923_1 /TAXON_ID=374046 /ORGANISM="Helicotheca tamensis, Strain CCMP826" /LENGTH=200 /DNA_ID=CAMNT_0028406063 /DNA_START=21 /DNA_END=623 /DNA_ORIENTATION=+
MLCYKLYVALAIVLVSFSGVVRCDEEEEVSLCVTGTESIETAVESQADAYVTYAAGQCNDGSICGDPKKNGNEVVHEVGLLETQSSDEFAAYSAACEAVTASEASMVLKSEVSMICKKGDLAPYLLKLKMFRGCVSGSCGEDEKEAIIIEQAKQLADEIVAGDATLPDGYKCDDAGVATMALGGAVALVSLLSGLFLSFA